MNRIATSFLMSWPPVWRHHPVVEAATEISTSITGILSNMVIR